MLFMNTWEVDEAADKYQSHPVLSKATRFLQAYRDEVNQNSDGWAYWKRPMKAAAKLMSMIQSDLAPRHATEADFKKALTPIKSFYTRHGYAAGMKWPEGF